MGTEIEMAPDFVESALVAFIALVLGIVLLSWVIGGVRWLIDIIKGLFGK